ncbi:hypothetical protein QAD02_009736 [Eretmocerus hayati]|uniref:Uncharacterized protein n=1 Tax=Eretmocerus hayati TaxID=131215 RepID=A0ACC2NBG5_9HYME|nr:hypothetical protein QAD02_009736 [Eretmocerus hayati]
MNCARKKIHQSMASCFGLNCVEKRFSRLVPFISSSLFGKYSTQCKPDSSNSEFWKDLQYRIKLSGPISVANYMKLVLTHPSKGYYINQDVFGQQGDFTTSPEISQLFGEMIGIWIISECQKFHKKPFNIVELGPGRGTLARDVLRVFHQLQRSNQISLHFVEVSPVLAEIQKKNLCTQEEMEIDASKGKFYKHGKTTENVDIFWYKSVLDLPEGFSVFIAQEFFDALPIHKFQKTEDGWFEIMVDVDNSRGEEGKFRYVLQKTEACGSFISKNERRNHTEFSPELVNIIKYISTAITQNGGFSLIIDYGHNGDKTDTFRAFRQHKQWDPLVEPGTADLTADVDFALLRRVAEETHKILCFGPVTQGDFLTELGINVRLMNLCKDATKDQRKQLELGYKKIVDSDQMGSCFKVMSMFPYVLKEYLEKLPVHGFSSLSSK